jgi:hypothetical protein
MLKKREVRMVSINITCLTARLQRLLQFTIFEAKLRSGNDNPQAFTFDEGLEVEGIARELNSALEKYRQAGR